VTSWQILLTGYAFEGQYDKILELLVQQLRTPNLSSIVVGDGWVSPPKKGTIRIKDEKASHGQASRSHKIPKVWCILEEESRFETTKGSNASSET
jgi:hypothetical protein